LRAKARPPKVVGRGFAPDADVISNRRWFVYYLQSAVVPNRRYSGLTSDVATRLATHNAGQSPHTSKYRPWTLRAAVEFPDEIRAVAFERYLKSGSGRAFARRDTSASGHDVSHFSDG
jgi:putative endonuclease